MIFYNCAEIKMNILMLYIKTFFSTYKFIFFLNLKQNTFSGPLKRTSLQALCLEKLALPVLTTRKLPSPQSCRQPRARPTAAEQMIQHPSLILRPIQRMDCLPPPAPLQPHPNCSQTVHSSFFFFYEAF